MADASTLAFFSYISDDIVLNILAKLESDPRDWARLSCVSVKFASLVKSMRYQSKSWSIVPSDLLSDDPGSCAALYKLSVCCPGLARAGVLLESSDFGLEREIGPDESFRVHKEAHLLPSSSKEAAASEAECCWTMFDDLYFDTVYDASEAQMSVPMETPSDNEAIRQGGQGGQGGQELSTKRRREFRVGPVKSHLASGPWSLSREQGNKLLASRFRGDSLYICEWPGCIHVEEKRKYMLFRGVFKNFNKSRVWRAINDGNRGKIGIECAFCECRDTWDLHSAFCLRRAFGFHDDGEPVVRAYVCQNGHVSGAWTEGPIYA